MATIKKLFTTSNANPSKGQRIAQGVGLAGAIGTAILGTGLVLQKKQKIKSAIKKAVKAPKNIVDKVKENREFKKQQRIIAELHLIANQALKYQEQLNNNNYGN
jgi:hypothetical protein